MKKMLIDITSVFRKARKKRPFAGFDRVILAYAHFYMEQSQFAVYSKFFRNFIVFPQVISDSLIGLLDKSSSISRYKISWLIFKYGLIGLCKKNNFSNYFFMKICTTRLNHLGYLSALKKINVKMIAVLYDLIPIEKAELCSHKKTVKFTTIIENTVKNAYGIIAISRTECEKFVGYMSVKGRVCPPIIHSVLAPGARRFIAFDAKPLRGPYFVIIGSISSLRKNHTLLLNVWLKLVEQLGSCAPKLVILGQISRKEPRDVLLLLKHKNLENVVSRLEVDDLKLTNYLRHAQALLFPSLAEGYGLPLVEALSLGTPVIANDLPVFHEIAGDVPDYIESSDEMTWLDFISDYSKPDGLLRQRQLDRIKCFVTPTWDEHFQRVDKFLDGLQATFV